MDPVTFTELTSYPALNSFMLLVALQFGDLWALMRLPLLKKPGASNRPVHGIGASSLTGRGDAAK